MVPPTDPVLRPSGNPVRLFRSRNYLRLWLASVGSSVGGSVASVALAWVVYSATHRALAVTLLGVANFVPSLIIGLLAGALADRFDRRRLMIVADLVRAAAVGGLAIYLVLLGFGLTATIVTVVIVSAMGAVFRPASNAILPSLLEGDDLADGNGLMLSGTTGASFTGSTLGGLLIGLVGVAANFSINAGTYLVSAAMIALIVVPRRRIPAPPPAGGGPRRSLISDVRDGLTYVRSQPALLWTIVGSLGANFFLAFYLLYDVIYVPNVLHSGSLIFGLMIAAQALGYGVGSLLVGRLGTVRRAGLVYIGGWSGAGVLIVVIALVPFIPVVLTAAATIGILSGIANTTYLSCVQRLIPSEFLGRFFSIDEVGSFAVIPLGQIAGGLLIVGFGVVVTFLVAGIGTFATTAALLFSRESRNLSYPARARG